MPKLAIGIGAGVAAAWRAYSAVDTLLGIPEFPEKVGSVFAGLERLTSILPDSGWNILSWLVLIAFPFFYWPEIKSVGRRLGIGTAAPRTMSTEAPVQAAVDVAPPTVPRTALEFVHGAGELYTRREGFSDYLCIGLRTGGNASVRGVTARLESCSPQAGVRPNAPLRFADHSPELSAAGIQLDPGETAYAIVAQIEADLTRDFPVSMNYAIPPHHSGPLPDGRYELAILALAEDGAPAPATFVLDVRDNPDARAELRRQ